MIGAGAFQDDQKMCIQYLSGKIEGFMAKDYVCVGALCVSEQVFGMADIIDVPLLDEVVWDGIIGLAFPNDGLEVKYIYFLLFFGAPFLELSLELSLFLSSKSFATRDRHSPLALFYSRMDVSSCHCSFSLSFSLLSPFLPFSLPFSLSLSSVAGY